MDLDIDIFDPIFDVNIDPDMFRVVSRVRSHPDTMTCYGSRSLSKYDDGFYNPRNTISVGMIAASRARDRVVVFGDRNDRLLTENHPGAQVVRWTTTREPLAVLLGSRSSGCLQAFTSEILGFSACRGQDSHWQCELWMRPGRRPVAEAVCEAIMWRFNLQSRLQIRDYGAKTWEQSRQRRGVNKTADSERHRCQVQE